MNISVVIPTFNRGLTLYNNLKKNLSVIDQNSEIVVSDNASDDQTSSLVASIDDKRIKYFRNGSNIGFIKNLIKAVSLSQNKWIILLSDEDYLITEGYQKVLDYTCLREISVIWGSISHHQGGYFLRYEDQVYSNPKNFYKLFDHPYMSGLVFNKDFIELDRAVACQNDVGFLYPHEFFNLSSFKRGKLITISSILCEYGPAHPKKMEEYKGYKFNHPKSRIKQLQTYSDLVESADLNIPEKKIAEGQLLKLHVHQVVRALFELPFSDVKDYLHFVYNFKDFKLKAKLYFQIMRYFARYCYSAIKVPIKELIHKR